MNPGAARHGLPRDAGQRRHHVRLQLDPGPACRATSNIVRLSARVTDVARLLLGSIARVLGDPAFERIRQRNHLVFAGHDDRISRALSSAADVRVVWGGDATVDHFRAFPLPPRGRDLTFPNRHSFAIIDADAVAGSR